MVSDSLSSTLYFQARFQRRLHLVIELSRTCCHKACNKDKCQLRKTSLLYSHRLQSKTAASFRTLDKYPNNTEQQEQTTTTTTAIWNGACRDFVKSVLNAPGAISNAHATWPRRNSVQITSNIKGAWHVGYTSCATRCEGIEQLVMLTSWDIIHF